MAESIRAAATPLRSWINDRGLSTHVPTLKLAVLFLEGVAGLRRKTPMLTAAECRAHSEKCVTLAKDPKMSYARHHSYGDVQELDRTRRAKRSIRRPCERRGREVDAFSAATSANIFSSDGEDVSLSTPAKPSGRAVNWRAWARWRQRRLPPLVLRVNSCGFGCRRGRRRWSASFFRGSADAAVR
jgi:hypothetical protein